MTAIAQQLEALLTPQQVIDWSQLAPATTDRIQRAIAAETQLPCVVYPQSEAELAAIVAHADRDRWRLLPMGQASKLGWGGLAAGVDVIVSTARLNRLLNHAVGDLVMTAEAGLSFTALQTTLQVTQQFLAIDPTYPDEATLGGIVATADTGALRQRYNSVRDMLIGIRFVRHDGEIVKAGGKVVKNVAGYDLMKLLTGSYGSLAIISQVTFRTYPLPETSQTVLVTGELGAIAQLCQTVKASVLTPASLDLLSSQLLTQLGYSAPAGLAVRFQTIQAGVTSQVQQLEALSHKSDLQTHELSHPDEAQLWQQIQAQLWPSAGGRAHTVGCKLGIPPAKAAELLQLIDQSNRAELLATGRIQAGSGLGSLRLTGAITADLLRQVRSRCEALGGFLSILEAPPQLKQQVETWGYTGNALPLMRQLKQQFDPQAILSPGRFIGGL